MSDQIIEGSSSDNENESQADFFEVEQEVVLKPVAKAKAVAKVSTVSVKPKSHPTPPPVQEEDDIPLQLEFDEPTTGEVNFEFATNYAGLSEDEMSIVESHPLPVLLCEFGMNKYSIPTALELFGSVQSMEELQSLTTYLTMYLEHKDAVIAHVKKVNGTNEPYTPMPVTIPMLKTKVAMAKSAAATNLATYPIQPEHYITMSQSHVSLLVEDPMMSPGLNLYMSERMEAPVAISPYAFATQISAFVVSRTNAQGKAYLTDSYQASLATFFSGRKLVPMAKHLTPIRNQCVESLQRVLDTTKMDFATLPVPEVVPTMRQLLRSMKPALNSVVEYMRSTLYSLPSNGSNLLPFTHLNLAEARTFRNDPILKDIGKDPLDLYSMRLKGVSVVKKFYMPIIEIAHHARSFVAVGHSQTNNWSRLLEYFGIEPISGQFTCEKVIAAGKKAYEPPEKILPGTVCFTIPEHIPSPFNYDEEFEEFVNSVNKKYQGNKDLQGRMNIKNRVLISDIYVPLVSKEIEDRKGKTGNNKIGGETYRIRMLDYIKQLKQLVDNDWTVIAKFVPAKQLGTAGTWDWESYWLLFERCYIKPYFDGRLHNGEVVLTISKRHILEGQYLYTQKDFMLLSKFMSHRMAWGNNFRNLLLTYGMVTLSTVPPLSKVAILFTPEEVCKGWVKMASLSQNGVLAVSADPEVIKKQMEDQDEKLKKAVERKKSIKELKENELREVRTVGSASTVRKIISANAKINTGNLSMQQKLAKLDRVK